MARSQLSNIKPYVLSWLFSIALVVVITAPILYGLQQTTTSAIASLSHLHGYIAEIKGETFAVQIEGQKKLTWFRVMSDSPISMAHLRRHLKEHATTDIMYYSEQMEGMYWAWDAD